jgi:O-antigen biosynthesis protein
MGNEAGQKMIGLRQKIARFNRIWREQGWAGLRLHARYYAHRLRERRRYQEWIRANELTAGKRAEIRKQIETLESKPLISVVMPVYNVGEKWIRLAIESVIAQLYPNWELCIADDASPSPHIRRLLDEYASRDARVKVVYRIENGHISAASNSALDLAAGEFSALLDHDDELSEDALYWIADEINKHPETAMIYSDEDKIDAAGRRSEPKFKPDWSRDFFYSLNLITHLSVYRTSLLRDIGGFRVGFEGSQDHDVALRVMEQIPETAIRHIPRILYHWRAIPGSVALSGEAKPYALEKGREAIRSHFERTGISADVVAAVDNLHRVRYTLPDPMPKVSLIVLVDDPFSAAKFVSAYSGSRVTFKGVDHEILLICPETQKSSFESVEIPANARIIVTPDSSEAGRRNSAALLAEGDVLCFVDPDLEPVSDNWLHELNSFALQDGIGAVGAKIVDTVGGVLHAGLVIGRDGSISPAHLGIPTEEPGYFFRAGLINNFSAVSISTFACRRRLFMEMEGFDHENFPDQLYDVDFCLRLWSKKFRVVFNPHALMVGSDTRRKLHDNSACTAKEKETFIVKWKEIVERDPFYNPNLRSGKGNFEVGM